MIIKRFVELKLQRIKKRSRHSASRAADSGQPSNRTTDSANRGKQQDESQSGQKNNCFFQSLQDIHQPQNKLLAISILAQFHRVFNYFLELLNEILSFFPKNLGIL